MYKISLVYFDVIIEAVVILVLSPFISLCKCSYSIMYFALCQQFPDCNSEEINLFLCYIFFFFSAEALCFYFFYVPVSL